MKDIRVVHDRCGCYADWYADDNSDPSIQEQWLVKHWDKYFTGQTAPNYPMPAIPQRRTFETLRYLGYVSAENNFPIDVVFERYIKS